MLVAHAKTRIGAPLREVYDFLLDVERLPTYDEKAFSQHFIDSETGLVRTTGFFALIPYSADFQLTRWPGKGCQYELTRGPIPYMRSQYYLRTVEGGTELTHIEEYRFHGPLDWLPDQLFRAYVQAAVEREVAAIQRLMEEKSARQSEEPIAL